MKQQLSSNFIKKVSGLYSGVRNSVLGISFLLCTSTFFTQEEFSFELYFEDAMGNKDTLVLGYDPYGTTEIDPAFNEVNSIGQPYNSGLDVRVSDEWYNREILFGTGSYQTKKQIVENNCGGWFDVIGIDILTENWPVSIFWDSTLFSNNCLNGSVFTSTNPGGWWDTGGFRTEMANQSEHTFEPNETEFNPYYGYINDDQDTLDVFWFAFGDYTLLTMKVDKLMDMQSEVFIIPNPASDLISLGNLSDPLKLSHVEIYNVLGEKQAVKIEENKINIQQFTEGIYYMKIPERPELIKLIKQ